MYLTVDALDECESDKFRLLDLIANSLATLSLEPNSYYVSRALDAFIISRIAKISSTEGVQYRDEVCEKVRSSLSAKEDGTFRWVALVCKKLETTQAGNTLSALEGILSGLQPLTASNVVLRSWTSDGESESIPCLDPCERKTGEEYVHT